MMKLITDLPEPVVGVVASGKVSAHDYETVLIPAIEAALKTHNRVRVLYQIDAGFNDFSLGAMWDDLKLGLSHLKAWEKVAVVTDSDALAGATKAFSFAIPCPIKVFGNAALAEAKRWIAA